VDAGIGFCVEPRRNRAYTDGTGGALDETIRTTQEMSQPVVVGEPTGGAVDQGPWRDK